MIAAPVDTLYTVRKKWRVSRKPQPLPIRVAVSRNDLPVLCRDLGFTRGAEIGVWRGAFSAQFCKAGLHMRCVDPWMSYPAWRDTKNSLPPDEAEAFMAQAYADAQDRLRGLRVTIMRQFSAEAAASVPDGSLDFVYIDANHVYNAVLEDVTRWAPKVRSGGIVAGHDYRMFTNKPTIEVVAAVNDYTTAHGIDPWFVLAGDPTPSWLWVKH